MTRTTHDTERTTTMHILTVAEVAALSGLPKPTIYRWASQYDSRPEAKRYGPKPRRDPLRPWKWEFASTDVDAWLGLRDQPAADAA